MRRTAALVLVLIALALAPLRAEAQAEPAVRIAGTQLMTIEYECFQADPKTTAGAFTLERDSVTGPLTVTFHISGGPTDLNADPVAGADHTVAFPDGLEMVAVSVSPAAGGGPPHVQVVDAPGYSVG